MVETWLLDYQCLVGRMSNHMEETNEDIQIVIPEVREVGLSLSEHLDGLSRVKGSRYRLFQQMFSAAQRKIVSVCRDGRNLRLVIVPINKGPHWGMIAVRKDEGKRCVLI